MGGRGGGKRYRQEKPIRVGPESERADDHDILPPEFYLWSTL